MCGPGRMLAGLKGLERLEGLEWKEREWEGEGEKENLRKQDLPLGSFHWDFQFQWKKSQWNPNCKSQPQCREYAKFGHTNNSAYVSNPTTPPNAMVHHPDMPVSSRLRAKEADTERKGRLCWGREDIDRWGDPHQCQVQGCHKVSASPRFAVRQALQRQRDRLEPASITLPRLPTISSLKSQQNQVGSFRTKIATWINANLNLSPPLIAIPGFPTTAFKIPQEMEEIIVLTLHKSKFTLPWPPFCTWKAAFVH